MARSEAEANVTQSVLERLTDLEPKTPADSPIGRAQSVRLLKTSLRRDLEWLLNTRRTPVEAPDSAPELQASLYNYGLPDITSLAVQSTKDQARLARVIEKIIAVFEPRLQGVRVTMEPDNDATNTKMLRFYIEGLLRMDPAPERISFDTMLELTSCSYQVKGEPGAR